MKITESVPQLFLAAILAFISSIATAQDNAIAGNAFALMSGQIHTQDLSASQALSFVVETEANKSYLIEVDQGGLDLIVTVESSDGISRVYNSPLLRDESELVLIDAVQTAPLLISLTSNEHTGAIAHVSIQVGEISSSSDSERELLTTWRLISNAALANNLGNLEGWESALKSFDQALDHLRNTGRERELARIIFSIAIIEYWQMLNWDRASDLAAQAATIYQGSGHKRLSASASNLQAAAILEKANEVEKSASGGLAPEAKILFDEAILLLEKALDTQADPDFLYDRAKTINNLGVTYYYMGDWDSAAPFFRTAVGSYQSIEEWEAELDPLSNLAVIDYEQGKLLKASESFQRILEILPPDKLRRYKADTLDNLAASQLVLGHLDDALQSFSNALLIHEQIEDKKGRGRSLAGIGTSYYSIGEQELALEYLETALEARQEANDGRGQVSVLNFIGNIQRQRGAYSKALQAHSNAQLLATSSIDKARGQILISQDLIAAGKPGEALGNLEQAESLANSSSNQKLLADVMRVSGDAWLQAGQYRQSFDAYEQAANAYQSLGLGAEQAQAIFGAAKATRELGSLEDALQHAEAAVTLVESLRSQLIAPELRAFFLASRQDYYAFLIDLLMDMHETSPGGTDDYLRQALSVSERRRARALVDLIGEASINLSSADSSDFSDRQLQLYQQMAESRYRLTRLLDRPNDGVSAPTETISSIQQELAEIENELNLLHIENRKRNPDFASLTDPHILDAEQIQGLLEPNTAMLQYTLGENRSFVWLVTRDTIEAWSLADRKTIEQSARRVYELLRVPAFSQQAKAELTTALTQLSDQILGPIGQLRQSRVVVVADGVLQYLPFSILNSPDEQSEQQALIVKHEIIHLPSMSVVAAQRRNRRDPKKPLKEIAIFADPVFSSDDIRLKAVSPGGSPASTARQKILLGDNSDQLKRLPATAQEALNIAELVDPDQRLLATGFDASRKAVINSNLGEFRIIHFATHGLIDSRYPALSSLAFSQFDELGRKQDGFLRLHDIYNLNLNADLVALSACSTALGREISGEGLAGLTQGLFYSGSSSVLASLWQVPDRATAELMKLFYQNLLDKKQEPASALRNAQLDLSSMPRWKSPYFWSAFVLQGEWQ